VVLGDGTDADFIAVDSDELEAAVQIFHVRGGRIRGQRGWVVERTEEPVEELIRNFLIQFYSDAVERAQAEEADEKQRVTRRGVDNFSNNPPKPGAAVPREILVQHLPAEAGEVAELLAGLKGAAVDLRVPQRGDKRALMETVERNAKESLRQHKIKRVGDLTARSAALQDIQEALGLEEAPLRIECTDISHIQGTDVVASLVVFEDGLPRKSDYRRYRIREAAGGGHSDDVASIAEITRRRFLRHHQDRLAVPDEESEAQTFADEQVEEMSTDQRRFAYPPNLFIVDGGLPQVNAAQKVFDELGIVDVTLIGLAKRLEEIWVPGESDPVILPRASQGLFLLQQIRDEAHRFAITYHRQQRSKRMRVSELDGVPGLGATRRTELVKHFGSVKKLKEASEAEIAEVKGFGPRLAAAVFGHLHPGAHDSMAT
jgi:excinuclease ABC subunit C